jgi:hypothetical protein
MEKNKLRLMAAFAAATPNSGATAAIATTL